MNEENTLNILKKTLQVSSELLESELGFVDYQRFTDFVREISGAKYAAFNIFEEDGRKFMTVALSGIDEHLTKATKMLGFDILNNKWDYDSAREKKIKDKKTTLFENLHALTGDVVPIRVASLIEKTFDISKVAIVRILRDKKPVGDFTLLFDRQGNLENQEVVELVSNLAGLLISRARAEDLVRKEAIESKRINDLLVDRELKMVALKEELNKLKG